VSHSLKKAILFLRLLFFWFKDIEDVERNKTRNNLYISVYQRISVFLFNIILIIGHIYEFILLIIVAFNLQKKNIF
jgi:hypothetical protein